MAIYLKWYSNISQSICSNTFGRVEYVYSVSDIQFGEERRTRKSLRIEFNLCNRKFCNNYSL